MDVWTAVVSRGRKARARPLPGQSSYGGGGSKSGGGGFRGGGGAGGGHYIPGGEGLRGGRGSGEVRGEEWVAEVREEEVVEAKEVGEARVREEEESHGCQGPTWSSDLILYTSTWSSLELCQMGLSLKSGWFQ